MKIIPIAQICRGQDGAIWGDYLFRFDSKGNCHVYDIANIPTIKEESNLTEFATFSLDKTEIIAPHSNSVMFGNEFYSSDDEFPLLYSNIYNNYANQENSLKGICCVYRLQRNGAQFTTTLVQLIEIGFVENACYWCSPEHNDIRPYGNFAIDTEKSIYYAFTMRDQANETRYFSFPLPRLADGVMDETFHVKKVTLSSTDIMSQFNCEYHRFVQGACHHNGKIYSVEGFTNSENNPPALRIINPQTKNQELYIKFAEFGLTNEPEFIDFLGDTCFYSDCAGHLYIIEF